MEVNVSGGAGDMCAHIANNLLVHGHQVIVIDNLSTVFKNTKTLESSVTHSFVPGVLNLGSRAGVSVLEFTKIVEENLKTSLNIGEINGRSVEPAKIIANFTFVRQSIHGNPRLSMNQMRASRWKAWENEKLLL